MQWRKLGRIWKPNRSCWWQQEYGIVPTPWHLPREKKIRIFFATTDAKKVGRITYLDVDEANPTRILYEHTKPVLDAGRPGCFDECGVNPSCLIEKNGTLFLFYTGYQRSINDSLTLFAGLGKWDRKSKTFVRVLTTPILERTNEETFVRSTPFVRRQRKSFVMWYLAGTGTVFSRTGIYKGRTMPSYSIRKAVSGDLLTWEPKETVLCPRGGDEFALGRPWILTNAKTLQMWYSIRKKSVGYRLGYAVSKNGICWTRKDDSVGIDVSASGWDSEMICYSSVITIGNMRYMLYNGNRHGKTGFGIASSRL
jgi:hypothetical protein